MIINSQHTLKLRIMSYLDLKNNKNLDKFLTSLIEDNKLVLFGGAIRDLALGNTPKDLDFVTDLSHKDLEKMMQSYDHQKNEYGGFKLSFLDKKVDIWSCENVYAFKEGKLPQKIDNVYKTAPFSCNKITYEFSYGNLNFCDRYFELLRERKLEIDSEYSNPKTSIHYRSKYLREKIGSFSSRQCYNILQREEGLHCVLSFGYVVDGGISPYFSTNDTSVVKFYKHSSSFGVSYYGKRSC